MAEGAGLLNQYAGNRIMGSNPILSALHVNPKAGRSFVTPRSWPVSRVLGRRHGAQSKRMT